MLPVMMFILLLHDSLAASDERPYFTSKNFNNVLHWAHDKRHISGEQVLYSVEYSRYGDPNMTPKLECQRITALSCDLTAETPPETNVQYIARVHANGVLHRPTYRFTPIADTDLGQPIVSVTSTMSSLRVNVTLPSGPNGESLADIFNKIKQPLSIEPTLYKLYITDPTWAAQVFPKIIKVFHSGQTESGCCYIIRAHDNIEPENESTSGQFVINLKNNNTKYCGYVEYRPHFKLGRPPSNKTFFCGTLKGDPWMVYRWFVIAAVLLVVLIIISVSFTVRYVNGGKKQSLPKVLDPEYRIRIQDNVVKTPDMNLSICTPTVCPQMELTISKPAVCPQSDEQTIYATIQGTVQVPSETSGGYSPQDVPWSAWDSISSGAPPVSQDTSNQSSAIYSAVGVHEPEEFQQATHEYRKDMTLSPSLLGKPNWSLVEPRKMVTSHEASPFPDLDSQDGISEGTLLLPTFRDSNGQLSIASMFKFESRSAMSRTVIPLTPKGQPLLSDLVDTGEGCPVTLLSLNSIEESELSDSDYDQSISPSQVSYNSHYSPFKVSLPASSTEEDQTSQMEHVTFESGYKQNWMPASPLGITAGDDSEHDRTDPSGDGEEDERDQILLGGWVIQIQG